MVDQGIVHIGAAQLGVAVGRLHLEDALRHVHDGHVERPAAQVEHQDLLFLAGLVQPVGQTRRGRLVDDAQDFQTRNLAGVLGRLPLVVVEVRRHRDDGFRHRLTEVGLGIPLDLLEDERGDLLRRVLLAVDAVDVVGAHLALRREHRPFRVGGRLAARRLADE